MPSTVNTARMAASQSQDWLRAAWQDPWHPLVATYVITGLLAILVPLIKYRSERNKYYNSYNYQYQQYDQQQEGEEERAGDTDINNCQWWQFWCESIWVNENGEYVNQNGDNNNNNNNNGQEQDNYSAPNWFSGWGNGNNQSGDSRDGGVGSSAAIQFVYAWQLILFLVLLAYGALSMERLARNTTSRALALQSLAVVLFLWSNLSFLAMWMLANGSIQTEGREVEENGGFFSQFSVLVFMTNFWYTLWGLALCIVVACKARGPKENARASKEYEEEHENAYHSADDDVHHKKPLEVI